MTPDPPPPLPARPLMTAAAMRAAEAAWFARGHDSRALMEVAGAAVARAAAAMLPDRGRIVVLAGPGNNGGDGHVAARCLAAAGHRVTVLASGPPAGADAAAAAAAHPWALFETALPPADLVIDALLGLGLARAPEGRVAAMIAAANAHGAPILAVDLPSGVDADTGATPGVAVAAQRTVSFHAAKPGHWLYPGRALAGVLDVADIGLPPTPADRLFLNGPGPWRWPVPPRHTHKYARGAVAVWSGPELASGAARLAALAAARAGAGAVTLVGDRAALCVHARHLTSVMLAEGGPETLGRMLDGSARAAAACVGPGAGPGARAAAVAALGTGRPLVLDADALTAFADDPAHLARLIGRRAGPVVLTPHEGEHARLFGTDSRPRIARAGAAAEAMGAVVVLKGPDSIVAAPDGRIAIEGGAVPWLATAGSGDVLAGLIAGLLAQGLGAFEAAAAGVFAHAAMGRALGPGLVADDLVTPLVQPVLARLAGAAGDAAG